MGRVAALHCRSQRIAADVGVLVDRCDVVVQTDVGMLRVQMGFSRDFTSKCDGLPNDRCADVLCSQTCEGFAHVALTHLSQGLVEGTVSQGAGWRGLLLAGEE